MKGLLRLVVLGAILAILAGGMWFGLWGQESPAVAAAHEVATDSLVSAKPPAARVPNPEHAAVPVESAQEDERVSHQGKQVALWVEGRVVVPPATPADERLRVRFVESGFAEHDPRSHGVIPEADGSFRLPIASGRRRADIEIEAKYLSLPPRSALDFLDLPEELILEPVLGARLLVHVAFADGLLGNRLDEVEVVLQPKQKWGDEQPAPERCQDGLFAFHGVRTQQPMLVQVEAAAWVDQELELDALLPGESRRLDVSLSLGATITGRVLDEDGNPVSDLVIEAKASDARAPDCGAYAISERNGSFELLGVPSGRVFLSGEQEGYLDLAHPVGELSDGERVHALELIMSRGETLQGRVTWPNGQPISRARVRARARPGTELRPGSNRIAASTTRDDGSFRIERLSPGSYDLTANAGTSAEEGDATPSFAFLEAVELPSEAVELVLRSGVPLSGRVVDDRGEPVSKFGIVVMGLEGTSSGSRSEALTTQAFQDEQGEFQLSGVPAGRWLLTAEPFDHRLSESAAIEVAVPGSAHPQLVCKRQATVAGIVLDRAGEAVAAAQILLAPTAYGLGLEAGRTWTDNRGRFELGVESGTYSITARKQGSGPSQEQELELPPGGELRELVLSLSEAASILVRLDPSLGKLEALSVGLSSKGSHEYAHGQTDRNGVCRIDDLAAGEYTVALQPFGGPLSDGDPTSTPRQLQQSVELVAGREVQVVLGRPSEDVVRIHGCVSSMGEPVEGERVLLSSHKNRSSRATKTDSEGHYEFMVAGGATYDLWLGAGQASSVHRHVRRVVEVPAQAQTVRLDIELPTASMAGVVLRTDGSPCAGAQVVLEDRANAVEREPRTVWCDDSGRFEFQRVEPGSRRVFAFPMSGTRGAARGDSTGHLDLDVEPGQQVAGLQLRLAPAGRLRGRVHAADDSVAVGVSIEILDENLHPLRPWSETISDKNGDFEFFDLAPGSYLLRATSHGTEATGQAGPVRVRAGEMARIDLSLSN